MADKELVAAREGFIGNDGKTKERMIREGDLLEADDPAVKKWPHLFGPPPLGTSPTVAKIQRGR
jgi:hypothetical protein